MNHIANMVLAGLVVFAGLAAPSSQVTLTSPSTATTHSPCLHGQRAHGTGLKR